MPPSPIRNFGDARGTLALPTGQRLIPPMKGTEVAPGVVVHLPQPSTAITLGGDGQPRPTSKPTADGGRTVDLSPQPKVEPGAEKGEWRENLALKIDDFHLAMIADELLQGIDADLRSRTEWEQMYQRGLDLLGVQLKEPTSSPSQGQLTGISTVNNPALLEACIRFQAGAIGEMLPADGPAKIKINGDETGPVMQLAEDFERDFNHYLTVVDQDFYPDTTRALFHVGFYGGVCKKPYWDPLLRRPVSRAVYLWDLIISQDAITIQTAARVTHRSKMRTPIVRRLMKQGVFKNQPLSPPTGGKAPTVADAEKQQMGIQPVAERYVDREHTIYECYCDLDLRGYEHTDDGEETGITLPYVVTIERDSKQVLALRRNWQEKDDNYTPRRPFVLFPFVLGLGFYPIGLMHILGNSTRTLTAIDREMVDAGMYANFPGGVISDAIARQETNEIQVGPGGFKQIKTGGQDIREVLMPFPYKDVTTGLLALRDKIMEDAQRMGGVASIPVGEGHPDIPVGTMLALIEQATKPEAATHKLLHRAQAEELQMLRDLFVEDPGALSRWSKDPTRQWKLATEFADLELIPVSDPNVPTHTHRVMQVTALVQLYQLFQGQLDPVEVLKRALFTIGIKDQDALLAPAQNGPPPGSAEAMQQMMQGKNSPAQDAAALMKAQAVQAQTQQQAQDSQRKAATEAVQSQMDMQRLELQSQNQSADLQNKAADRASKERIAQMQEETERLRLAVEEARGQRELSMASRQQDQAMQMNQAQHQDQLQMQQQGMAADHQQHQADLQLEHQGMQSDLQMQQQGMQADQAHRQQELQMGHQAQAFDQQHRQAELQGNQQHQTEQLQADSQHRSAELKQRGQQAKLQAQSKGFGSPAAKKPRGGFGS